MARQILKSKADFEDIFGILETGLTFTAQETGFFTIIDSVGVKELYNLIFIPYNYNPEKQTDVHVYLHGGVINANSRFVDEIIDRDDPEFLTRDFISVYPSGWVLAQWWDQVQMDNIDRILRYLKRSYNIDENRIFISGFSDGGTGTYYFANTRPTCYAGYISMCGNPGGMNVLSDVPVFAFNLADQSFMIIATRNDKMFDFNDVFPYFSLFQDIGKNIRFFPIENYGHSLKWFPLFEDTIQYFYSHVSRDPYPDTLFFASDGNPCCNRKKWVVIDKTNQIPDENWLTKFNRLPGFHKQAFKIPDSFGWVEIYKDGNNLSLLCDGVEKLTLLCSPRHFDFDRPVKIDINGEFYRQIQLEKSTEILLKWAGLDLDRKMLFGDEIVIRP